NADDQSVGAQAAPSAIPKAEASGVARLPAETRGMPASENDDSQEAELRSPQSGAGAAIERRRSDRLHPRRRPQSARALDPPGSRGPGARLAGRPLPHHPRRARLSGRRRSEAGSLEVRCQARRRLSPPPFGVPCSPVAFFIWLFIPNL